MKDIAILGSGISGLSAAWSLNEKGLKTTVFEKDSSWGGLCDNFVIDGFRFDRFVHLFFAPKTDCYNLISQSVSFYEYKPLPYNYYHGYWLKHPAQSDLYSLPTEEKIKIINDFIAKPSMKQKNIKNYEQWLLCQYGTYFSKNFPSVYTKKYWGCEAKDLGVKWLCERMYVSDVSEVLRGSMEQTDQYLYYIKNMQYPQTGGFKSILNEAREGLDIQLNKKVVEIDIKNKLVFFEDKTHISYTDLISSIPLPDIVTMIKNAPVKVVKAAKKLRYTSGYQVSLGFNKPDIAKHLWFYIYDEDILPARIYSPSLKSPDNAPKGCSSLQAEIFVNSKNQQNPEEILSQTIEQLIKMNLFNKEDIVVQDIRFEKYANVVFDNQIYINRKIILDYLKKQQITSIGRFGKWDYLWSHQAFEDGIKSVQPIGIKYDKA